MENMFAQAVIMAFEAHKGQFRKESNLPFVIHPLRVSECILANWSSHPNLEVMRVAAVLHDTIEDTNITNEDIEKKFGLVIANIVQEVTAKEYPSSEEKQKKYLEKLINASDEAKIIKISDISDNIMDIKNKKGWLSFFKKSKKILSNIKLRNEKYSVLFEKLKEDLLIEINEYVSDNS